MTHAAWFIAGNLVGLALVFRNRHAVLRWCTRLRRKSS